MGLLYALSYVTALTAFVFVILSLASGLLWIAEFIEEHSRMAKTIGQRAIWVIIGLHVSLYFFDSLPLTYLMFSAACHVIYSLNITSRWPLISLTSPVFIASCALVFIDHFMWFGYFHKYNDEVRRRRSYFGYKDTGAERQKGFGEIATFFALCIWAVPLFLFLSLSANEYALPTSAQDSSSSLHAPSEVNNSTKTRISLLRRLLNPILSVLPFTPKRKSEPLIAPPSPNPCADASHFPQHLGSSSPYHDSQSPFPTSPGPGRYASPAPRAYEINRDGSGEGWANVSSNPGLGVGMGIGQPPPPRIRKVGKGAGGEEKRDE